MLKRKWIHLTMLGTLALLMISNIGNAACQGTNSMGVKEGTWIKYQSRGTGAYISYEGRRVYVTVTSVNQTSASASGTILYNTSLDMATAPFTNAPNDPYAQYIVNVPLEPYVVRNDSWTTGPIPGSEFNKNWKTSVTLQQEIYYDVERTVYNYTKKGIETHDSDGNRLLSNVTYIWDEETGILCEWGFSIENLDEPVLSGEVRWELTETSEWELTTGAVPGFPVGVLGLVSLLGFFVVFFRGRYQGHLGKRGDRAPDNGRRGGVQ
ncbi:MAG: hypothetical protein ACTSU5_05190 [Promethearchaeota archaeon]